MSISAAATQFNETLANFYSDKPEDFFNSGIQFSDFDGPNQPEVLDLLQFIRDIYQPLIAAGKLKLITRSALNTLNGQVQNARNTYISLRNGRDQSNFQSFALALDSLAYHTRMFGIPYLTFGGDEFDQQRNAVSEQISLLSKNNAEVEALKKDVRTLITPAIAGSLSEAFRQRRDSLYKGRLIWLLACLATGYFGIKETLEFVQTVSGTINLTQHPNTQDAAVSIWIVIAIRTIVLLPLFAAFGFAFSQYRKERDFEEEYAHKAAVANSLPNYGDLARDKDVRDKIVTAATSVIFISPSEQSRKAETNDALLGTMREIVETMSKALSKK